MKVDQEGLIITPEGVFKRVWNGEVREYQNKPIKPKDLIHYCWEPVSLEGNVLLGQIFSLVAAAPEKWELVLGENIGPFLEESQKPHSEKGDLSFVELHWAAEMTIYKGEKEFTLWPSFHGIGFATEDDKYDMHKKGDRVVYAIEFTPVNDLAQYPLSLDESVKAYTTDLDAFDRTNIPSKYEETDLGNKPFTLLEIIKGIFWELTFLGTPEHRDAEMESIRETVDGIKDGSIETIPWNEVEDKLKKRIEEQNKKDIDRLLDEGI